MFCVGFFDLPIARRSLRVITVCHAVIAGRAAITLETDLGRAIFDEEAIAGAVWAVHVCVSAYSA